VEGIVGICERLIHNYRLWRAGFPDLIVWNASTKQVSLFFYVHNFKRAYIYIISISLYILYILYTYYMYILYAKGFKNVNCNLIYLIFLVQNCRSKRSRRFIVNQTKIMVGLPESSRIKYRSVLL